MPKPKDEIEELKGNLKPTKKPKSPIPSRDFLSSSSTLLDLSLSGKSKCGFAKGHFYWWVGGSGSGKTWFCLAVFAEASINPEFDDYDFIFDQPELGAVMDLTKFFGKKLADRIRPPKGTRDKPIYSRTVEEFYYNLADAHDRGRPFIYLLDSMDALGDENEDKFFEKKRAAKKRTKKSNQEEETGGTYAVDKPKQNSSKLRRVVNKHLPEMKSMLFIISQTRDNIGFGARFNPERVSSGRALKFYATTEIWTKDIGHLTRRVRGKDREIGIRSKIHVEKNRITGKDRTVIVPILHSHGIDDIGSCVDWLVEEDHWEATSEKKKGKAYDGKIKAIDFEVEMMREKLIEYIEENNLERALRAIVTKLWNEIEDACAVKRKNRYE